jgi:cell division transport system permease protein
MRLTFFLREAMRSMRRNAAPSFAALATVLVTMLVVGVFIPAVEVTNSAANTVRGRLIVDVYMKTSASAADNARVHGELLRVAHVKSVHFESKVQAYAQQSKQNPLAYQLLGTNPLPDTWHVIPDNPSNVLAIRAALTPGGGVIDPAIQSVSNKKSYTKKALELTAAVK